MSPLTPDVRQPGEPAGDDKLPARHPADFVGDRRQFLEVMGASLALATGSCMPQPNETIVPYVKSPEYAVPGQPRYFATAITLGGYATGVLVESHEGRPTRIDGNPDHTASLGAVDAITQSAVLSLYDPDRSQAIMYRGTIRTWEALTAAVEEVLRQNQQNGARIRVLTETVTSPTLAAQLERLLAASPGAKWHQYEPINRDNLFEGLRLAYGRPLEPRWKIERADVIVAFDVDFLGSGPGHLRFARGFMSRRQPETLRPNGVAQNRLYVVEPIPTPTGATADHRLTLRPSHVAAAATYLAAKIGVPIDADTSRQLPADAQRWLDVVARDLVDHRGSSLVMAGIALPPQTYALVARINAALDNVGATLEYTEPVAVRPENQLASLQSLVDDIDRGEVELLVILEGNPVYTAPVDFELAKRLRKVPLSIHLSGYQDETSACCQWHVPAAHALESWSDARAMDGTVSVIQPLIAPLYGGKTAHELIALLSGQKNRSSYEIVRDHWREHHGEIGFESIWRRSLHAGHMEGTSFPAVDVTERDSVAPGEARPPDTALEIALRPDPTIYDGRFANNGWLQELPKPITKLTWHNAALLSSRTAQRLAVTNEDVVEISAGGRSIALPVWIVPGHADDCVTVHLGYGRTHGGRLSEGAGANAYRLRRSASLWTVAPAELRKTSQRHPLASTQHHHEIAGRDLIHEMTFTAYRGNGRSSDAEHKSPNVTLYDPPFPVSGDEYAWGMSINLTTCVACNACMIACQAENNIPVVGEEQVRRGREMHWIRVDSYFEESGSELRIDHQPIPCMHCENAPCEVVCPVEATVHSVEGLNEMVYNRCVGTRYCSNNCPYKVRRFNFLDYHRDTSPVLELLPNPNVTVRSRGVMEKCTYCVQRINTARIASKREGRRIRDGEVIPACQAACPTQAIVFGDIHDTDSRVAQRKSLPLDYGLLTDLNTRPRTTYLARLTNPNPDL